MAVRARGEIGRRLRKMLCSWHYATECVLLERMQKSVSPPLREASEGGAVPPPTELLCSCQHATECVLLERMRESVSPPSMKAGKA